MDEVEPEVNALRRFWRQEKMRADSAQAEVMVLRLERDQAEEQERGLADEVRRLNARVLAAQHTLSTRGHEGVTQALGFLIGPFEPVREFVKAVGITYPELDRSDV